VISALREQPLQVRFRSGMCIMLFNFVKFCKHNMLGLHLDQNFHDLTTNKKVFLYLPSAMTSCRRLKNNRIKTG